MRAGIKGSKGAFRKCFFDFRQRLHGLSAADVDGPPRGSRPIPANVSSNAPFRVHMSRAGVLNNILSWKAPNDYRNGDLLLHFAGPDKRVVNDYLDRAYTC